MSLQRAELLSPAGNWDSARAAVENGADAVYFGVESLNARVRAANFTLDDLPALVTFLHERGVKGYLALNVLIFSDELPHAAEILLAANASGVDAVLIQDIGLARLSRQLVPELTVHASTQMTVSEPTAMGHLQAMGIRRFVLPRELSVAEIERVHAGTESELEAFVHGALCVAWSGQCLTSESLGGRSANRGQCAQACRQPYELFVDGNRVELGERRYLLSPRDLAGIERIPQLLAAGVTSFKIEGRLKTPEYVANITRHYRKALDAALAGHAEPVSAGDWREMALSFSRGFSPGFLDGVDHQSLVDGRFPKSRGLAAGRVTGFEGNWICIADCGVPVKPGDGIVFDNGDPERKEPGGPVYEVARDGAVLKVAMARDFSLDRVAPGDRVWKTGDPALNRRLQQSFAGDTRTVGIRLNVSGGPGAPLSAEAVAGSVTVAALSDEPLVASPAAGLTREIVTAKLGRLGGTRYHLENLSLDLAPGVSLPVSSLNRLRRKLVKALDTARGHVAVRPSNPHALAALRAEPVRPPVSPARSLALFCRTAEQIKAACAARPDRIYADFEDPRGFRDGVALARAEGIPIYLATPRIEKPGEEGMLRRIAAHAPDGILARNLGALLFFRAQAPALPLVADFSLNTANDLSARHWIDFGVEAVTPAYDLNARQLDEMLALISPAWFEVVVHQHMPMFHMEHCVFAALLSQGKDYRDCGRPCERHGLTLHDSAGGQFPVLADAGCRNTVFNGQAQSGALYLDRFLAQGVRRFRVELLGEDAARTTELLALYRALVDGTERADAVWTRLGASRRLGVTRGTLDR